MPNEKLRDDNSWDVENETYDEFKVRRSAGRSGMGQSNSKTRQAGRCDNTGDYKKKIVIAGNALIDEVEQREEENKT